MPCRLKRRRYNPPCKRSIRRLNRKTGCCVKRRKCSKLGRGTRGLRSKAASMKSKNRVWRKGYSYKRKGTGKVIRVSGCYVKKGRKRRSKK